MKPVSFKYVAPDTLEEAVQVLAQYRSDAKILAGGQSLMPLLNMRLARPAVLVDVNRIAALDYIRQADGGVAIGAITRQRRLEDTAVVAERLPLLKDVVQWISHPQIRNRGTVVGSIAHGDPSAELPAAAVALDAQMTAVGPKGARTLTADALYLGYLATALQPDEFLTEVRFPSLPAGTGWSVQEVARRHGDFALVGVIALLSLSGEQIGQARLTYFGVGGRPVRFLEVENLLSGRRPCGKLFAEAAAEASTRLQPGGDLHASAEFRRAVAGVLTRRVLNQALSSAQIGARP